MVSRLLNAVIYTLSGAHNHSHGVPCQTSSHGTTLGSS